MKRPSNNAGFTLVEMIVSIVLLGILAAGIGLGMTTAVEGLFTVRSNAATAQKTQAALLRIEKELHIAVAVTAGASDTLTYESYKGGGLSEHELTFANNTLVLDGDALLDNVESLSLQYLDTYNDPSPKATWESTCRIIEYTVGVRAAEGVVTTHTKRIAPRNM